MALAPGALGAPSKPRGRRLSWAAEEATVEEPKVSEEAATEEARPAQRYVSSEPIRVVREELAPTRVKEPWEEFLERKQKEDH